MYGCLKHTTITSIWLLYLEDKCKYLILCDFFYHLVFDNDFLHSDIDGNPTDISIFTLHI